MGQQLEMFGLLVFFSMHRPPVMFLIFFEYSFKFSEIFDKLGENFAAFNKLGVYMFII
jgi:hypothetical protein